MRGQEEPNYEYDGAYLKAVCADDTACRGTGQGFVSDAFYDGIGRLSTLDLAGGDVSYAYHTADQRLGNIGFLSSASVQEMDLEYAYENGAVVSVVDSHEGVAGGEPDASFLYGYDHRGRLAWHERQATRSYYRYDSLGNLTGMATANPGEVNQTYGPTRPRAVTAAGGVTYGYDSDGNAVQRGASHFDRDPDGLITCEGTTPGGCQTATFQYLLDGERLTKKRIGGSTQIEVGEFFLWNKNSKTARSNVFAFGRQISQLVEESGTLRTAGVERMFPGLPTLPEPPTALVSVAMGFSAILILACAGSISRKPLGTTLRVATSVAIVLLPVRAIPTPPPGGGGATYVRWYLGDHIGSGLLVVDANGLAVERRVFEPFGGVVESAGGTEYSDQIYAGGKTYAIDGVYEMGARWYDPGSGRFLSMDPLFGDPFFPQRLNPYSYTLNQPTIAVDPSGRDPIPAEDFVLEPNIDLTLEELQDRFNVEFGGSVVDGSASDIGLEMADLTESIVDDLLGADDGEKLSQSGGQPQSGSGGLWDAVKEGGSAQGGVGAGYHLKDFKIGPLKAGGGVVFGSGGVGADSEGWFVWGESTLDVQLSGGRYGGRAYLWDVDIGSRGVENIDVFGTESPTWDWSIGVGGTWTPYSFEVEYDFQPLIDYFKPE